MTVREQESQDFVLGRGDGALEDREEGVDLRYRAAQRVDRDVVDQELHEIREIERAVRRSADAREDQRLDRRGRRATHGPPNDGWVRTTPAPTARAYACAWLTCDAVASISNSLAA